VRLAHLAGIAGIIATSGVASSRADAQSLDIASARLAYEHADFESATVSFERVLAAPNAQPSEVLEACRYLSALRVAAGRNEEALEFIDGALSLDSSTVPPQGANLALQALFDQVRTDRRGHELRLHATLPSSVERGRNATFTVSVEGVPALFRAHIHTECTGVRDQPHELGIPLTGTRSVGLVIHPTAPGSVVCTASLLTAEGALLSRTDARAQPGRPAPVPVGWIIGGTALGAVAVTALVIGLVVGTAPQNATLGPPVVVSP
jgi:hypothetical protein